MLEPPPQRQSRITLSGVDIRIKIIITLLFSIEIALSQDFHQSVLLLILALCYGWLSALELYHIAKRVMLLNSITLFLWLTLPFCYNSGPSIQLGSLQLARHGIDLALLITIKSNAALLTVMALLSTSSISQLGHGLSRLHLPQKLCLLLLFSYRYIAVIGKEYKMLSQAATLRCFQLKNSLHSYKTVAYLFAMTLVRSHERALRVQEAMQLRGFNGTFPTLEPLQTKPQDLLFFVFSLLALIATITL